jgi:chemotaxis protein methyltransferase CheR
VSAMARSSWRGAEDDRAGAWEFAYTRKDFSRIAALLQRESGIRMLPSKASLVYSRLAKRLRALRIESFGEYCELVGSDDEERMEMLAALTTNVTRFFREPHHFDHLKRQVLPPLLEAARDGARVRLWSAGCSSGQEPYSIALTVLSLMPDAARYDIKILATDIDPNMIARGRRGVYSASDLRDVPGDLRQRGFERVAGENAKSFRVADTLNALVSFRALNLMADWPMRGAFEAIFCRNVVIYFEESTQSTLWSRLASTLSPGGCLYIGHSERVFGPSSTALESVGVTTYRLRAGARE